MSTPKVIIYFLIVIFLAKIYLHAEARAKTGSIKGSQSNIKEPSSNKKVLKSSAKKRKGKILSKTSSSADIFSDKDEDILLKNFDVDGKINANFLKNSIRQALYEQEVEDLNTLHKIDNHIARRLIVMPLTDAFQPHQADQMHGKIQYGDKCSLPTSIGRLIFEKRYEVPWIFEIKPVRNLKSDFAPERICTNDETEIRSSRVGIPQSKLSKAYISPLDFRSPENYIFIPRWMMHDLNLKVNDLVDISLVRIKLASLAVFQPLSIEWDALMKEHSDPKVLLEHELNKYSSLTAGSTIYISIKGKEYPLYVKEIFAEGGVSVNGVRIQDSDLRTDIDRSLLDKLIQEKQEKQ